MKNIEKILQEFNPSDTIEIIESIKGESYRFYGVLIDILFLRQFGNKIIRLELVVNTQHGTGIFDIIGPSMLSLGITRLVLFEKISVIESRVRQKLGQNVPVEPNT